MRLLATILTAAFMAACDSPAAKFDPDDQFLLGVTVIDVASESQREDMGVVVRDRSIFAVIPMSELELPSNASVVHHGGFVIPGLWDMHVHTMSDPNAAVDRLLPLYVAHGITGVRDMGSIVDGIVETRTRLDADSNLLAPEILASGPLLDGVSLPWYGDLPLVLTDPSEVDAALSELLDRGIDFFKVYDQLSPDVYEAVLQFAAERDISVAGHPPRAVGITDAAKSGQLTIEHLSVFAFGDCVDDPDAWFRRALNAKFSEAGYSGYYDVVLEFFANVDSPGCIEAINALVENETYLTPTLVMEMNDRDRVNTDDLDWMDPAGRSWCESTLESIDKVDYEHREAAFNAFATFAKHLHDAGVKLLAGSDNPNYCLVAGASLHWELERLVEAGLSPNAALATATINPAAALGRESTEGHVREGYRANLLVLSDNPIEDIRNTRAIAGVFLDGRWVGPTEIDVIRNDSRP